MKVFLRFFFIGTCMVVLTGIRLRLPAFWVYPAAAFPVAPSIRLDSTELTVTTIASGLDVPWEMIWGPDNWIWFTEQGSTVSKINPKTGEKKLLLKVLPEVHRNRTLGLLSMALHPDMKNNPYIFLNYIYQKGTNLFSKWVRYSYTGTQLNNPVTLLEVPADIGHNGSRIVFAPDGKLMLATGDADHKNDDTNSGNAQSLHTISGKILRLNLDGTIPADNPFPGSAIWALGFRVPQGLVYGTNGNLYSAEHGNVNDDEVNLIRRGGNYGYPNVRGKCDQPSETAFCKKNKVIEPIAAWTPTIAPAGIDYYNKPAIPEWRNDILMVTLKTQSLRLLKLNLDGTAVTSEKVYFEKAFGRLREICVSPAGEVYISTSNRDWNPAEGFPKEKDDRIIRIAKRKSGISGKNPATKGKTTATIPAKSTVKNTSVWSLTPGALIYTQHCASCHKADGGGVAGSFPALRGSKLVTGNKEAFSRILLQGISGSQVKEKRYDQDMPAFAFLQDKELAEVGTYVRSHFGNQKEIILPGEIGKARASLRKE